MLSHGGILKNCEGALEFLYFIKEQQNTFLTWLPLSHSYEHTVQFVQLSLGAKIFYSESLDKLLANLKIARPTIMTAQSLEFGALQIPSFRQEILPISAMGIF